MLITRDSHSFASPTVTMWHKKTIEIPFSYFLTNRQKEGYTKPAKKETNTYLVLTLSQVLSHLSQPQHSPERLMPLSLLFKCGNKNLENLNNLFSLVSGHKFKHKYALSKDQVSKIVFQEL